MSQKDMSQHWKICSPKSKFLILALDRDPLWYIFKANEKDIGKEINYEVVRRRLVILTLYNLYQQRRIQN